jgi:hypothetical protein
MRRSVMVGVFTAVAALVGAVVATPALADTGPGPRVPQAALDASLTCSHPADPQGTPVLLVPGTALTPAANFDWNYERVFDAESRPWCAVELPGSGLGDIQVSAEYVVNGIRTMHDDSDGQIAVVGYSQGGMLPRWALKYWPDTRGMVKDVIGIAPSNHGTVDADALCATVCAPSIRQQTPASNFLTTLNDGPETFAGLDYTVAYSFTDEVVVPNAPLPYPNFGPSTSSPLRGGAGAVANIAVQDICPGHVADHLAMGTFDPVAYAIVADALDHDGTADPARIDRSVCTTAFMPGVDPVTFAGEFARFTAAIGTALATSPKTATEPPTAAYTS